MCNDFNTIIETFPWRALADYSTFRWNKTDFFVLSTPAHTLTGDHAGRINRWQASGVSGDLIHSPGKIQNLYDTQIRYGGSGFDRGVYSLARRRDPKADLLCSRQVESLAKTALSQQVLFRMAREGAVDRPLGRSVDTLPASTEGWRPE